MSCRPRIASESWTQLLEAEAAAYRVVYKQNKVSGMYNRYAGSKVDLQLSRSIFAYAAGSSFALVENLEFII